MILSIVRTGLMNLRRDRAALLLSFVLPIAFFSIFAIIFGRQKQEGTPKVRVAVVDQDRSPSSQRLVAALQKESALRVSVRPAAASKQAPEPALYDAASAEAAVRSGSVSVAILIPNGFSANAIRFGPGVSTVKIKLLTDSSDPIAPQLVQGLLQKTVMTSMPDGMAAEGMKYFEQAAGGITPQQREAVDRQLKELEKTVQQRENSAASGQTPAPASTDSLGGMVGVEIRDVVGDTKRNPLSAFYAAGIGVMFLLFSASGAGGAL
jgi:ABC-2 type transport system permease protein